MDSCEIYIVYLSGWDIFLAGYVEGTEENLSEALSTCLSVYNEGTSQKIDLVFFSDAVRHAARLSRVLVSYNHWI